MKRLLILWVFASFATHVSAQTDTTINSTVEQQLENLTEVTDAETEDDSYLQSLMQYRRNKINLNTAETGDLKELKILSDLQIQNLMNYRRLLGNLVNIYELQAIPTWDVQTIQRVLPFVQVANAVSFTEDFKQRFAGGRHSILIRGQQVLEKSDGFSRPDTIANRYLGSPQRIFIRYKYSYKNLLQFGLVAEKDAGEQLFKGNEANGFDFYSFHLYARNIGIIKTLALGDFTVNLGQGLIQWQSLAFKKGPDITAIKRQSDVLRPYNSAGEFNFERGAGITLGRKDLQFTAFGSIKKVDANFNIDTSINQEDYISSILTTGYHRTPTEIGKKNSLTQTSFGGNVSYNRNSLHLGLNGVAYKFSAPLVRDIQPYNQYAVQGDNWHNFSIDYSYTYNNLHFFGEAAKDKLNATAFVNGLLVSLSSNVDASLVYRNINKKYQALYGNAFTEGTFPTNEKGLYAGITIRPSTSIRIDAYGDVFRFPWLRYRVDAPSEGSEYYVQLTYKPNKQVEVYTRYRNESKAINLTNNDLPNSLVYNRPKQNWRTQVSYNVSRSVTLRNRIELVWYDPREQDRSEQGFVAYFDAAYRPFSKPFSINGRLQYFETDGFDSRIYTFENDVLYSYSIPQFASKGYRYYLNLNLDVTKKLTLWARLAQTIYNDKTIVGSGLDEIPGNKRTEVKLQMMYAF